MRLSGFLCESSFLRIVLSANRLFCESSFQRIVFSANRLFGESSFLRIVFSTNRLFCESSFLRIVFSANRLLGESSFLRTGLQVIFLSANWFFGETSSNRQILLVTLAKILFIYHQNSPFLLNIFKNFVKGVAPPPQTHPFRAITFLPPLTKLETASLGGGARIARR